MSYTDTAQQVQAIKAINPNTVVLAYFNPLFGGSEGKPHEEWYPEMLRARRAQVDTMNL